MKPELPHLPDLPPELFRPIGTKVCLLVLKARQFTGMGLAVPEVSQDKFESPLSMVVSVGPDVKQVKRGDLILTTSQAVAYKVRREDWWSGQSMVVVEEGQVLGVVNRE